jgi:hypothetical protein
MTTRPPAAKSMTPGPAAAMTPAPSWPATSGNGAAGRLPSV